MIGTSSVCSPRGITLPRGFLSITENSSCASVFYAHYRRMLQLSVMVIDTQHIGGCMNTPKRLRLVPVNSPEGQAIAAKRRQVADRMRSNEDKSRHAIREAASKFRRSL